MAIGERIRFFRNMRGMTQKQLGKLLGLPEKSADVRLAQYEKGARTPKAELINSLAKALDVSPQALAVPNIDSCNSLMHTLFALEDRYGLKIDEADGKVCLKVDVCKGEEATRLHELLCDWCKVATMLKEGKITQEEYDNWRYRYRELDTTKKQGNPRF